MILGGIFDIDNKMIELSKLESQTKEEGFWQNVDKANDINKKIVNLQKIINSYKKLKDDLNEYIETLKNTEDKEIIEIINSSIEQLEKEIESLETKTILSGEYDDLNCFIEIHPGAGGTESCDWASMLARMYQKFCEKKGYKYEIVEEQKGEEAGIKSITIKIIGDYAYGYLKKESGIHRLVRISPFDSGARRHTSFAAVSVIPEIKKDINIEIKEEDLKIDVYHSSGAGGQSVNTSNSAVRITHLPTKTVVTCQNERSQLKNKEQAMAILKNKLFLIAQEKQNSEINTLKDSNTSINFGSQIRSYILEPYKLVKDHRSNFESSDPVKVLDGYIENMLLYNLKKLKS